MLVAYNLWLATPTSTWPVIIARRLRRPDGAGAGVRRSAIRCRCRATSIDPTQFGPAEVYDAVAAEARVARAELVGLVPESVLRSVPAHRWTELDLAPTGPSRPGWSGLD